MIVKFVIDGKIFAVEVYENNENGEVFVHDTYHCNVAEEKLDDVFYTNDQMIVLESGDLMKKVEEKRKNYIKAILMAWGETGIKMNTDEDEVFLFMEDTQEAFAYLNLEKEWKQVNKKVKKIITKKPDDWFNEIYVEIDELVDLIMRDL